LTWWQQLLNIWRKAKGKERDALLWGDEVSAETLLIITSTNHSQIEYLVVQLDDKDKKARLSLCQAEVLKALAHDEDIAKKGGAVPEIQAQ
jgi:glutamate--cysteine ligase catalytic subunit